MAAPQRRSDCPINFGLELFGDKWTLLVVRDMMFKGKHGYGAFLESGEHIATNILADRLHQLEVAGLIVKRVDPARKSRFIYAFGGTGNRSAARDGGDHLVECAA
ncbi:MAG: helix-turn-helix domain-containing protein [Bacteroidia bacterium]